jgi:triosephosphate isomerase
MPKPRGIWITGNWKMNHGPAETAAFFKTLKNLNLDPRALSALKSGQMGACVFPPSISLDAALKSSRELPYPFAVGAQNAHWEKKGAFTGELSGPLLKEIGIGWSLVGHSERRQFFGETNESAKKRTVSLIEQGIRVILCLGESRAERESGQTANVILKQIRESLPEPAEGTKLLDGRILIAYEPVWAIGTGLTATPAQAEEAHQIVRKELWDRFGMEAAGKTSVLYGGSVTTENARELLACPNVDGALVGGASLKPESFAGLLNAAGESL